MKAAKWLMVCSSFVLLFSGLYGKVGAATFSGRSSTVIEWFGDPSDETAVPIYQYILLNVRDVDNDGMNFKGYGRLATDTQDVVDVDSRLYYAYLEKRGVFDSRVDFRYGDGAMRQLTGVPQQEGFILVFTDKLQEFLIE